jgi:hypothetical protein
LPHSIEVAKPGSIVNVYVCSSYAELSLSSTQKCADSADNFFAGFPSHCGDDTVIHCSINEVASKESHIGGSKSKGLMNTPNLVPPFVILT